MSKNNVAEKIVSLRKHIDRMNGQKASPPAKHKDNLENYLKWINLEIARTEKKIQSLI